MSDLLKVCHGEDVWHVEHYAAYHAEQGELEEADRCAQRAGEVAAAAWSYAVDCVAPDYRLGDEPDADDDPVCAKCLRAHEPTCPVIGGRAALTTLHRPDGAS